MPALRSRHRVALIVDPGVSVFEMSVAWEVFGSDYSAEAGFPWYELVVSSSVEGPLETGQAGVVITATRGLGALRRAHTIVVPPIRWPSAATLSALRVAHARGARIVSLCTGAFVLAAAGVLDGRRATTHWANAAALAEQYPDIEVDPRVLYVDDGNVITSAGSAAGIDMCLHVVRSDFGAEVANRVARDLVVPPHRAGGQAQFIAAPVSPEVGPDLFAETLQWAQVYLDQPLTVEILADRSAMSTRSFARRFRLATGATPHQWVLRQRLLLAQRLLETTDLTIDRVAEDCGMGTATNLRVQFHRMLGTNPSAYRRAFRALAG